MLLELIEEHLRKAGYEEVEPGQWTPPNEDEPWVDGLLPTIQDCIEREAYGF